MRPHSSIDRKQRYFVLVAKTLDRWSRMPLGQNTRETKNRQMARRSPPQEELDLYGVQPSDTRRWPTLFKDDRHRDNIDTTDGGNGRAVTRKATRRKKEPAGGGEGKRRLVLDKLTLTSPMRGARANIRSRRAFLAPRSQTRR